MATPIGNLDDASPRVRSTLAEVELIAAEDTRHTGSLLSTWGISRPLLSLHEHNERSRVEVLLEHLRDGADVALVSDAGTPLLADPGYRLVRAAVAAGLPVRPIPGPCALIAALSVCGLPTDRFLFAGFLPARSGPRRQALAELRGEAATLIFYETPHRVAGALAAAAAELGGDREAWVGRELTKRYETHYHGRLAELAARFASGEAMVRGEFVVVIGGAAAAPDTVDVDATLRILLEELPASRAARVAAKLTGRARQALYQRALELGAD